MRTTLILDIVLVSSGILDALQENFLTSRCHADEPRKRIFQTEGRAEPGVLALPIFPGLTPIGYSSEDARFPPESGTAF